eukprot:CAMPEP_0117502060 /NCGR_PEP_ID=MMETSP0784-20121206/23619_1 /TAXON_ID=39447 /ORGANISM="" /LENGTH=196 /DNA_ID=CAMNT_0005297333 /DNA_START=388 /DNA_END=975 /DNA_ORIENTATION=-
MSVSKQSRTWQTSWSIVFLRITGTTESDTLAWMIRRKTCMLRSTGLALNATANPCFRSCASRSSIKAVVLVAFARRCLKRPTPICIPMKDFDSWCKGSKGKVATTKPCNVSIFRAKVCTAVDALHGRINNTRGDMQGSPSQALPLIRREAGPPPGSPEFPRHGTSARNGNPIARSRTRAALAKQTTNYANTATTCA